MSPALSLLAKWAAHLADVYERRGRSDVYSLEVLHTCHGCGGGSGLITNGLCEFCLAELKEAMRDPSPPMPTMPATQPVTDIVIEDERYGVYGADRCHVVKAEGP